MNDSQFTHIDAQGNARMVDVSGKAPTSRTAVAVGRIAMSEACFAAVRDRTAKKGDVLGVAQVAGIMATKRTAELIPLCHLLNLTKSQVEFTLHPESLEIEAVCTVRCEGKTGVEMEALTGVSLALLTWWRSTGARAGTFSLTGRRACDRPIRTGNRLYAHFRHRPLQPPLPLLYAGGSDLGGPRGYPAL